MLEQFFKPKTIAIIGASDNPEKVGYALMKNLSRFRGRVIPINPKHKTIQGREAYASVLKYPGKIDLVVIAIPAKFAPAVLIECGKKKVRNVIVITAGFSETGNLQGEKELESIAKKYKINLLGPNCFGVANPYNSLDTTFAKQDPEKGRIAFVSQSGALWSYICDFSIGKFGFSKFASLGNPIGLGFSDFIEFLSKDKKTGAIVLYIEKINNGKRFLKAAKGCKKPMFAVKSGQTEEGSEAAISHTGSLATDYEVYKGAFRQAGVVLCESLEQAFEKASRKKLVKEARKKNKLKFGKKVAIVTNAGGAGALAADYCASAGLDICGVYDLLGTASASDYKKMLNKLKKKADSFVVIATPQVMTDMKEIAMVAKKHGAISCILGKNNFGDFNTLEEFRKNI